MFPVATTPLECETRILKPLDPDVGIYVDPDVGIYVNPDVVLRLDCGSGPGHGPGQRPGPISRRRPILRYRRNPADLRLEPDVDVDTVVEINLCLWHTNKHTFL